MTPPAHLTEPAVPARHAPYVHPVAALVVAAVLLRYGVPDFAEALAQNGRRPALPYAMDLITAACLILGLGLNLSRSHAWRKVAERGPEAGERRARLVGAWNTPVLIAGMIYSFQDGLPGAGAAGYVTPILFALINAYASHLHQAATDPQWRP